MLETRLYSRLARERGRDWEKGITTEISSYQPSSNNLSRSRNSYLRSRTRVSSATLRDREGKTEIRLTKVERRLDEPNLLDFACNASE